MSVTEQFQGWGSWSVRLKGLPDDTTPATVWEALDPDDGGFGHILITPTRVDPDSYGDAAMKALSRYTGIYRGGGSRNEISGIGMVGWLADEDGKGDIYETAVSDTQGFEDWIDDLLPDAITKGTVDAIAGNMTASFRYTNPLAALSQVMDYFGGVFRVNPDGTLDAGEEDDLFATTPEVLLTWQGSGPDSEVDGIRASQIDLSRDLEDWTSKVVLLAEGEGDAVAVGTATIGSNPYKDFHGNAAVRKRLVNAPDAAEGNADTFASAQLGRFDSTRKAYSLSSDEWGIRVRGKRPEPGDYIWVYDPRPDAKLRDTDNQVTFQGRTVFPVKFRLEAITWPIQEGMGVYFRDGDGNYTDLSNHVEYESAGTTLDVGAAPRTLTSDPTPAQVQARLKSDISATRRTISSNQSISNSTVTGLAWLTEVATDDPRSDYTYQDSGGAETRIITVNRDGWYHIEAGVLWDSDASGRRFIEISDSGTSIARSEVNPPSGQMGQHVSTTQFLSDGDYIRVQVFQSSGGGLNAVADARTFVAVHRVKP